LRRYTKDYAVYRYYVVPRVASVLSNGAEPPAVMITGRGLHSFPFQLNLSSSVHRISQLNS
jgi:hypothetical protein